MKIRDIEDSAVKYTLKNVGQCWNCKHKGTDAVFKDITKPDDIIYYRVPECVKHHCYTIQIDQQICPEFESIKN